MALEGEQERCRAASRSCGAEGNSLRIVLVNNYYYLRGGCERVLLGDQHALVKAGFDVSVFSARHPRNLDTPTTKYFPTIADRQARGRLEKLRAATEVVYSPSVGRAFSRFLDDYSPDVIHCHNIYGTLTTAVLDQAKKRGISCVLTAHDLKLVCPSYLGLRQGQPCLRCADGNYLRCVRWKCHKDSYASSLIYAIESFRNRSLGKYDSVNRLLCPSNFLRAALLKSGVALERTLYHPNAVPASEYRPNFTPGNYILYAGRLSAEKGLRTLLEAARRIALPVRIAGDGPMAEAVKEQISRQGLPVTLEGYRSGEELAELYRNSAFMIVPSECHENASMAILESFAYGKPVLASDIGGNPELVIEGKTGSLFAAGDAKGLAEAARFLWSNPLALEQMGRRARSVIETRFSQERRTVDLINIYRDVSGRSALAQS